MNFHEDNWFYKMCKKQGGMNVFYIVFGAILFLAGIMLFTAVISILNVLLSFMGALMIFQGGKSMFSSLPALGRQIDALSAVDRAGLGNTAPDRMYYSTFYFTDRFLCAPSAYAMMRYDKIKDIHINEVRVRSGRSVYVNVEFTDGRPSVNINVKDWGTLLKEAQEFMGQVAYHRARLTDNM